MLRSWAFLFVRTCGVLSLGGLLLMTARRDVKQGIVEEAHAELKADFCFAVV